MIHKALAKLREQRGSSLIFGVAMAVFLLILSLVVMEAVKTRATVAYIQTTAQQVLDNYTDTQGRSNEDSFKSGNDHATVLDQEVYIEKLQHALDIGSDNTGMTDGRVRFVLSDITLSYTSRNEIDSTASIHIKVPLNWDSTEVTAVEGNITIRSRYEEK